MVYSLTYRRPTYVTPYSRSSINSSDGEKSDGSLRTNSSSSSAGIPEALSFNRIISDGTCPPCTTRDFMNYLVHIEHAAENLQFFLWYRDYSQRFKQCTTADLALSLEWTQAQQDAAIQAAQAQATAKKKALKTGEAEMFKGTDFSEVPKVTVFETKDPFSTPPGTADMAPGRGSTAPWDSVRMSGQDSSCTAPSNVESNRPDAGEAFLAAGLKRPFSIQPFRKEIDRVMETYVFDGAPRQLNLSSRERSALLRALEYTTHPSAFSTVASTIEMTLRRQSHPNFIRWTICNGNRPRVIFARGLGVGTILLGIVVAILITLSNAGRGWRALAAIGWIIGIATLISAWKGMCVVLHGMHHRHLRPWELFEDTDSECDMKKSFDSFGSSNSYEDEPWIVKYDKRNIIRKVFDREVWVQEPALRQIQDTIFLQSILSAFLGSAILTAIFVALPKGHFY